MYRRYNSSILVSKKQYFRFKQIFLKVLLPFYGYPHVKTFKRHVHKYQFKKTFYQESLTNITELFERRLDVISYRLNFAPTIKLSRTFINLGFLAVNGQQQTDPNYLVADFSTIQLLDKTR
jgi:ribosomal protein S4